MVTNTRLEAILERLEAAQGLEGIQSAIVRLRDEFNVAHLVYHWVDSAGDNFGCGTYSRQWRERYEDRNYLRIDPVIQGCYQQFHPVDWKRLDWSSKAVCAFRSDATQHGVGNQGFSVPIRGPNGQFALFTANDFCSDEEWSKFIEEHRRTLIIVAHYFNEKALELEADRQFQQKPNLAPREIDAMTLLAMGYSRAQAADTLSISEHTLRVYIESARSKLRAHNTTHAVARAMSQGLIVI